MLLQPDSTSFTPYPIHHTANGDIHISTTLSSSSFFLFSIIKIKSTIRKRRRRKVAVRSKKYKIKIFFLCKYYFLS